MAVVSIPSSSITLFNNSVAPIGWTKLVTDNDVAIRVTSGTASSGGSVAFSGVFTSFTPSGSVTVSGLSVGTTVTEAEGHVHAASQGSSGSTSGYPQTGYVAPAYSALYLGASTINMGSAGGNAGHSHSISLGTNPISAPGSINFAVKYLDMITARRN